MPFVSEEQLSDYQRQIAQLKLELEQAREEDKRVREYTTAVEEHNLWLGDMVIELDKRCKELQKEIHLATSLLSQLHTVFDFGKPRESSEVNRLLVDCIGFLRSQNCAL